ncbi:MAG: 50S ribosomal protein L18e [Nanoarchaeota archaeon]|nr:50S ribosomal protein L18e [Nanoarchaeota archaeon]
MAQKLKIKTTNQELFDTIRACKKVANSKGIGAYNKIADELSRPASQRAEVNLEKIEKLAKTGDVVVIPGKILATGILSKKVHIVAFSASDSALEKIQGAGATFTKIQEYVNNKPATRIYIMK